MSTTETDAAGEPEGGAPLVATADKTDVAKMSPDEFESQYGITPTDFLVLQKTIAKGAPPEIARFFALYCKNKSLDPFSKKVYLWPDKTDDNGDPRPGCSWNVVAGIDGLRSIASRSPFYRGQKGRPRWSYISDAQQPDGIARFKKEDSQYGHIEGKRIPEECEVIVQRAVPQDPTNAALYLDFYGVARFDEFVKRNRAGKIFGNWEHQPEHQLRVRSEAMALRMGFPEEVGGIYTEDELRDRQEHAHHFEAAAPIVEVEFPPEIEALAKELGWERPLLLKQFQRYANMQTLEEAMRKLQRPTSRTMAQQPHKPAEEVDEAQIREEQPENVVIHATGDKPEPEPPAESFESANYNPAPGSVKQKTLGILFGALSRRGVKDERDRHYWAIRNGFEIGPFEGGKKDKASFSNLSEAAAHAFLDLLTVYDPSTGEWRDRVILARCEACGSTRDGAHDEDCPIDETDEAALDD